MQTVKPRRRQARGERRIAQLLDAAADVFATDGYTAATTNAIAAAAGVSPGTLYQFFPNKQSMAEALADQYIAALAVAHDQAADRRIAGVPLDDVINQMVDPAIRIASENHGFTAVFHFSGRLQSAVTDQVDGLIAIRVPELDPSRRRLIALVTVKIFEALLPAVLSASGRTRTEITGELKRVLRAYLLDISD
ncbi:AcrR family transcriptional regulator [Kibdelosporangium banguiense]|uniref:AcrR family transcriptional regulator n=1 Tax=Kibdelosporangium banguiense TaxID=1365924 RepID=A0ABS4TNT3_9PSEU|nr:TetR/AcrR family transcriptional regulator [Kibdelosporangium banguiense]MBP2325583.1 AcrR family transcriptional regulator [Kibdelosporangium banguiense]